MKKKKNKYEILDSKHYNYLNNVHFDENIKEDKDIIDMYKENFSKTKKGFEDLKFPNEDIDSIFKILNGILYLGNIKFIEELKDNKQISKIDNSSFIYLEKASKFLGLDQNNLKQILTEKIKKYIHLLAIQY